MREILFRGKRVDNGEWVYGYYAHLPSAAGAADIIYVPASDPDDSNHTVFVDPKTVGQYTGLTDNNGVKIFEGDIIRHYNDLYDKNIFGIGVICWDNDKPRFYRTSQSDEIYTISFSCDYEVIGNIYDNPELIEDMDIKPAAKMSDAPAEQLGLAPAT